MPIPVSAADFCGAGDFKANSGHTEWVDARSHQTGFTTVFGPNTKVVCTQAGAEFDVETGEALCLPATDAVETYDVKVEGDDIYVLMED